MIQITSHHQALQVRNYRVHLGHVRVLVQAANQNEALQRARQQMSVEFPRLWDMIHEAPEARFVVSPTE